MSLRVRLFFDVYCANSWIGYKTLQSVHVSGCSIEYLPIINKRLLFRRKQHEANARYVHIDPEDILHGVYKKVTVNPLNISLPDDYEKIQEDSIKQRSSVAAMFLTSLKMNYPDRYLEGIELLGNHVWTQRLPTCRGFQIFRVAEKMGFEFRECDALVTSLCDYRVNQVLADSVEEAFQLGAEISPFYQITNGENMETADDIEDALKKINKFNVLSP